MHTAAPVLSYPRLKEAAALGHSLQLPFLPCLKYVLIEATTNITDGLIFGQLHVHLGASCNRLCLAWRELLVFSHRSTPEDPTTKILPHKPSTITLWDSH